MKHRCRKFTLMTSASTNPTTKRPDEGPSTALSKSMPGFSSLLFYILLLTIYVQIQLTTSGNTAPIYDDDEQPVLRCEPMCKTGWLCERHNGKGKCMFAKSLIAIIIILSLLGIVAFAAGVTIFAFCFCAAFHQEGLNRIIRKNPSQVERERKRNERKKRPISATYFDDELQRRRAENPNPVVNSMDTSGTTVWSAYCMGPPPPPPPPRTPQAGVGEGEAMTPVPLTLNSAPGTPAASPPGSVFVVDLDLEPRQQNGSVKTNGKTPSNKSNKSAKSDETV